MRGAASRAELVLVDSALRPDHEPVQWQERTLNDGARFTVYKRYFDPPELAEGPAVAAFFTARSGSSR